MLTATQALQKAADTTRWAVGMCDNFVANMFGYSASGYATAVSHWNSIPGQDKHPGDMNAPAGALMFWGGGAGHVALSDGHGGIFSTDYPTSGVVSHVSASVISKQWNKPYLGWSVPVFQGQVGNVAQAGFTVPSIPGIPGSGQVATGALDTITGAFGTDAKDLLERAGLIVMGGLLMVVGIWRITGGVSQKVVKEAVGGGKEDAVRNQG